MIVTTPPPDHPEYLHKAYGTTIRMRRLGAGVTLRACAERMGMSMTALSAVEQGAMVFTETEFDAFNRILADSRATPTPDGVSIK